MVVVHAKRPLHLRIAKMARWIERRDADGEALANEKMRGLPSYFLIEPIKPPWMPATAFSLVCAIQPR